MAAIRAQVILHTVDNNPENYISNSWAFDGTDPGSDVTEISTALQVFYIAIKGAYPNTIATAGHEIKFTDLPGTPPNYPFFTDTWTYGTGPTQTPLPSEVAICLSFQGSKAAGFPQARRRGRVYLGPLGSNAAGTDGRPSSSYMTTIATAAGAFKDEITAIGTGTTWAIWSVTDQAAVDVTDGWIDNAFDTQRRRGIQRTSRTVWS